MNEVHIITGNSIEDLQSKVAQFEIKYEIISASGCMLFGTACLVIVHKPKK